MEFFVKNGISSWHSNPYLYDPNKPIKSSELALSADEYATYFKQQYDCWLSLDDAAVKPNVIYTIINKLCGLNRTSKCSDSGICLTNFINFDDEGNATICPKFLGYKKYRLGNIATHTISDLLSPGNQLMKGLLKGRFEMLQKCLNDCRYFTLCNGGCLYRSILSGESRDAGGRDYLCRGKKDLFEYIDNTAKEYGLYTLTS
jgi:radical SAM protein with 4Fe4S-binding SPASM domain